MCESLPWLWDTLIVTDEGGNTDGKYLETMLPGLRGGTKPSILDKWTDLPWSLHHHCWSASAGLEPLPAVPGPARAPGCPGCLMGCHLTWGWGGGSGTPLCLRAQHRGGGLEQ